MHLVFKVCVLMSALSLIRSLTHDEISKCFLTGVHKTRQTIIESPNYPNNYTPNACWDYVIRSPFKCPTTFHIQFLDFYLEFSKDCKNDYLAIGLENIDDDMDVLCGQVVGIKKYHTPDGILRLRFFTDESHWTTGKGFKLLVTRLACEREELLRDLQNHEDDDETNTDDDDDDTIAVAAPSRSFEPPESELMQIFRNLTGQEQYQIVPVPSLFTLNYPTQLPSPPYPATGTVNLPGNSFQGPLLNYLGSNVQNKVPYPCTDNNGQKKQFSTIPNYYGTLKGNPLVAYPNTLAGNAPNNYLPSHVASNNINQAQHQESGTFSSWSNIPSLLRASDYAMDSLEACCVTPFQQKHFYLSSPGFPRTVFSNILPSSQKRDCVFHLQKSSPNVCRLRLDFKFFDFGQSYHGTGSFMGNIGTPAIQSTQDVCQEDFIEIDNQRFCGCRSGYTFIVYWTSAADMKLRMRMGYSGIPSGGFLLEIVQEECTETQLAFTTTERPIDVTLGTVNTNLVSNQVISAQQTQQILLEEEKKKRLYGSSYPSQQQQPLQNINTVSYPGHYPLQQSNYLHQTQQFLNTPVSFPANLQQQYPVFIQEQQQQQKLQPLQNNNAYPSNYLPYFMPQGLQQNILQQPSFTPNPFGLTQTRYARSYVDQQPVTVVETNSTRKEFYYSDNDSLNYNEDSSLQSRSGLSSAKWDRKDANAKEQNLVIDGDIVARERRKCSFEMGDILRLSVDILWITKPICYAPQRNWFTNWIG